MRPGQHPCRGRCACPYPAPSHQTESARCHRPLDISSSSAAARPVNATNLSPLLTSIFAQVGHRSVVQLVQFIAHTRPVRQRPPWQRFTTLFVRVRDHCSSFVNSVSRIRRLTIDACHC